MTRTRWTRRDILSAGAALAVPCFIPDHVLGLGKVAPPSETVRVGIIGCGSRARMIREAAGVAAFRVVAVCDCIRDRAEVFAHELSGGKEWQVYEDFRKMIERENLDAVMIETTTHARAWIAIQVMQAGLDVYLEKPMCLTIAEGRQLVLAARRYGRVTQVGTQQRSMPINNWASDLVKNGRIGLVHTVLAPNFIGPELWKDKSAQGVPTGSRNWWDVWTNQAPLRPYHRDLHLGWARWRDYDGGGLCFGVSGWGTHSYDQVNRALGTDETGPVEVMLEEPAAIRESGRFVPHASVGGEVIGDTGDIDTGVDYHSMAKLTGLRGRMSMKFANGTVLKLQLDGDRGPGLGAIFIGERGKIEINRNRVASNPRELTHSSDNPGTNTKPETQYHIENWLECIKTRARCTADIEYGQRATTLCELVNIARHLGKVGQVLNWDPADERFTNCDEGNALLSRERRPGYELPAIV